MKKVSVNFKTTNIKGKQYVEVKDRIKYLSDNFDYSINSDYQYFESRKIWVVKSTLTITTPNGEKFTFTGLAQETESDSYKDVNYSSALENAETSAVGRACAMAGIGIDISIASADEMNKALNRTPIKETPAGNSVNGTDPHQSTKMRQIKSETLILANSPLLTQEEKEKLVAALKKSDLTEEKAEKMFNALVKKINERENNKEVVI